MQPGKDHVRARVLLIFWTLLGVASVTQGHLTSLKPGQSQDLRTVKTWLDAFQEGQNPYYLPQGSTANYPPHGIAFLSLLATIPDEWLPIVWSTFNLGLSVLSGYLAFRIFNPTSPRKAALLPVILFLSWAGLRIGLGNGQLSLLMLSFGLLAVATVDRSPLLAGALLGFSAMKPHVGATFFLWALFTKRLKAVVASIAVGLLGLIVFSIRVGESPIAVVREFISVLRLQFGGQNYLGGVTEFRPLVHAIIPNFAAAEAVHLFVLVSTLVPIGVIGMRRTSLDTKQRDALVLQLTCLWCLLAVFHNPYDLILMLPVMAGFYSYMLPQVSRSEWRQDVFALWLLQAALVAHVPGLWWKLARSVDVSGWNWAGQFLSHFDRVLIICFFVFIVNRLRLYWLANGDSLKAAGAMVQTSTKELRDSVV